MVSKLVEAVPHLAYSIAVWCGTKSRLQEENTYLLNALSQEREYSKQLEFINKRDSYEALRTNYDNLVKDKNNLQEKLDKFESILKCPS